MAKRYDPIMCMLVDEPTKAQDELSLAQKKQVVTELKGYLKKSYNFSDESEYARAYEDLRHMFTTGSRKSISGLFENTVKKTGAKDSASALDKAIKTCDDVDDIYVRRNNEYYVNVKLGKSNPQISATISRILNKDKRVEGVLGSPGNWDVAIEGKDNAEYIKKILSGVGNIK